MAVGKDIIAGTVPSDKSVRLFESIIANSYQRVLAEFDGADLANKARRAAIVKQLNKIVEETHMDLQAWGITQIPAFYEAGAFEAAKDLVKGGQALDFTKQFTTFHKEAIASLINETSADIASAMQGMKQMTQRLVNQATKDALLQQVAVGKITGDSRKAISKGIVGELRKNGITSLTDKAGKKWNLANYGKMLARTKLTQAHNSGVMMRLAAEGNDLVIVSDHISACPLCQPWENKVLSVSGKSAEYPSLQTAQAEGLFHPNCRHAISPLPNDTEYLNGSKIWDANKQEYVDFNGVNNARGVGATPYGKEITIGKDAKVYRAIDSKNGEATLGNGTYFAFDRKNVERYGKDIQVFHLQEGTKMLQLGDYDAAMKFAEEARKQDPEKWMALMKKYGDSQGLAHVINDYAGKLGYDGIIGDDAIFGSVVFKPELLKKLNAAGLYDTTKASIASEFSKLSDKELPLSNFHLKFLQDREISFGVDVKTRTQKTAGVYRNSMKSISLNKSALKSGGAEQTFFHELGHAIDHRYTTSAMAETSTDAWASLPKDDMRNIVINRLKASNPKLELTDTEARELISGLRVTKKIGDKTPTMQLPRSYRNYLASHKEIFADGYGQYITNPKEFKKYAPDIFDYFEKLSKNYGG